jgi:hypothetical protein
LVLLQKQNKYKKIGTPKKIFFAIQEGYNIILFDKIAEARERSKRKYMAHPPENIFKNQGRSPGVVKGE